MKLYKLPGSDEFVSWDVLHNEQGYSLDATNPVTWLSAGTVAHEWGETVAGGYMEPTEDDGWSTNGFCHGKNGWHNMDDMANIFYVWPNIATSTKAWHNSLGESNVAVWEYDGENSLYLVQKELQEGWMNEETFAERGWEIVDDTPYEFVFVDSTTGRVTSGVERLTEMEFVEAGYFTIEDTGDVVFVEQSAYPIVCEYSFVHYESIAADSGITTTLPYYSQKLYIYLMSTIQGSQTDGWEIANDNGFVRVINRTGSSVTVVVVGIRFIDATDAQVVEVEKTLTGWRESAFKWTSSGTDYYFIPWAEYAAGWVDDLSSIGWQEVPPFPIVYSFSGTQTAASVAADASFDTGLEYSSSELYIGETNDGQGNYTRYGWEAEEGTPAPVLPTVSNNFYSTFAGWLNAGNTSGATQTIASNSVSTTWYYSSGMGRYTRFSEQYDSSKSYAVMCWNSSNGVRGGYTGFSIVNANGLYGVKNTTSSQMTVNSVRVTVCSSSQATVVTVYSSSNVAYNAFKFTASGTDYYYVLDGVQADWTDDLSSIGYSLTPAVVTAYFTNKGASATSNTTISPGSSRYYTLYDASGSTISRDSSKTYTFYKAYRYDGTEEGFSAPPEVGTGGYWYLDFHVPGSGWSSSVFRVEYTVS